MAYYGDEPAITLGDVFTFIIGFFFFVLTVVALIKIISIAKDVRLIRDKSAKEDNPSYYFLMGDKEKAKEILTKQMVAELEETWRKDESNFFNHKYWKKEFDKIDCEMPEIFKDIKSLHDYKMLFEKKEDK